MRNPAEPVTSYHISSWSVQDWNDSEVDWTVPGNKIVSFTGETVDYGDGPEPATTSDIQSIRLNPSSPGGDGRSVYVNFENGEPGPIPATPAVTTGDSTATVTWDAPADIGASATTGYTINAYCTDYCDDDERFTSAAGRSTVFRGLDNGEEYEFTVTAQNSAGDGPPRSRYAIVGQPGFPTNISETDLPGKSRISWTAPAGDGGSPVTSYRVVFDGIQGAARTVNGTTTDYKALEPGSVHQVTVAAVTEIGTSQEVESWWYVIDAPTKPLSAVAVAGNRSANVSWAVPEFDNGTPLTGYTVRAIPGPQTCTTTGATGCTVAGLTNGKPYTFRVNATKMRSEKAQPATRATRSFRRYRSRHRNQPRPSPSMSPEV